jgi:NADH-quinone oxidoreductase subunit M
VMLKFGAYGFMRFAMPMFPLAAWESAPLIGYLAVAGIVLGALLAYVQEDVKKLVAYSSVSHLGFVVLGLLTLNPQGIQGGIYQMLAHGISTGGLFLGVGVLYDRRHTRKLDDFGGLWKSMPVFSALFLVIVLASVGLPGLCGFVGEFLVLVGTFTADKGWADLPAQKMFDAPMLMSALSATAVIFAAMYLLKMYQKLMFGPLDKPENRAVKDIHGREVWVFGTVVVAALLMGLFPKPILDRTEASVQLFMKSYKDRLAEAHSHPDADAHFFPEAAAKPTASIAGSPR